MDAAACAKARAAMDEQFGPEPAETVPNGEKLQGHASQTHTGGYVHGICHPNPAMASIVELMPRMTEAHCQVLRSSVEHSAKSTSSAASAFTSRQCATGQRAPRS